MKMPVSSAVLQETTRCHRDFLCQTPEWAPCARIRRQIDSMVLHEDVGHSFREPCRYHVDFGNADYCTCPARIEIYRRYGV